MIVRDLIELLRMFDSEAPVVGSTFGRRMVGGPRIGLVQALRVRSPWRELFYDPDLAAVYPAECPPEPVRVVFLDFPTG